MFNNAGRQEGNPLMGAECAFLRVGDVCAQDAVPVAMLIQVSATTTSSQAFSGARGVEISVVFSNAVTDCDIDIIVTTGSGDQTLVTYHNVTGPNVFYLTPAEGYDLAGWPVKVKAYNFGGGGNVTISLTRTS